MAGPALLRALSVPLALGLLAGPWAALPAHTRPPAQRWMPPVLPLVVVRPFDLPEHDWLPGHRGVDLRAAPGSPVRAVRAGVVTFAADLAGRGVVVVDHGTLRTTYEPVDAEVSAGERVGAGEVLGAVGTGTGHCGSGRCLHLGLRRGRTYLDPMLLRGPTTTRLRPW
jgi:murein DD-endopeptidase MepM/ murein hydrolase activator NlpD